MQFEFAAATRALPSQLSATFLESARKRCPLLEHILLDQCDLVEKGVNTVHDPYSPLQVFMVSVCVCVRVCV